MSLPISYDDVVAAHARLQGVAHKTPVLTSSTANAMTGAELFFKAENFQRMGAFKFRGAYNALSQFTPEQRKAGVITFSSGNHAQGVALSAKLLGMRAVIVMPKDAPALKVEAVRVPLRNPEFAPFIQRVKDTKPQAVFVFLPAGEQGVAFMKGFRERGLAQAGIKVIATGDLTDDHVLPAMGDSTLGVITSFHYSAAHDSPQNKTFLKAFAEANPGAGRPNFMAVAAYDGIGAIYDVINKLGGKIDGEKAMAAFKGMKIDSPRGPITIDPATRDVVQTVYIRKVEKVGNELYNVEFDKFADVKDPGK